MFDVSELIICSPLLKIKYSFITAASEDITQQNCKCRKRTRLFFQIVTRTLSDNNQVSVVSATRKFLIGVCQVCIFSSALRGFSPGTPVSLQHPQ